MQCRLVPFLCFVSCSVIYLFISSFFPVNKTIKEANTNQPQTATPYHDISYIWKTRPSEFELKCEASNDYFKQLEGHNWNKWMAKLHDQIETYESDGVKPRVPCNNYWHTGRHSCLASYGSKAYSNYTLKSQCDAILDNGFERGRVIPMEYSRNEGWPHLGPNSLANKAHSLPSMGSSGGNSRWAIGYPLESDGTVKELSTLELLSMLSKGNTMNEFAVNLGANDGATSDPVAELYHHGWHGVAVELESRFCDTLGRNLQDSDVTIHCPKAATPINIHSLLKDAPLDMDYLKIDIDSYDCDVLDSILRAGFRPKVIQMETGTIPPPVKFASRYHQSYTRPHAQIYQAFGCSLSYVDNLLKTYDSYELIEASLDSIWVRSDVLSRASQPIKILEPMEAYVNGFWRYPWRRELHIWEIGTEHWFQLRRDRDRISAIQDHMQCVDACFHSEDSPFLFALSI